MPGVFGSEMPILPPSQHRTFSNLSIATSGEVVSIAKKVCLCFVGTANCSRITSYPEIPIPRVFGLAVLGARHLTRRGWKPQNPKPEPSQFLDSSSPKQFYLSCIAEKYHGVPDRTNRRSRQQRSPPSLAGKHQSPSPECRRAS